MNPYIIIITIVGLAALGMAWMPSISRATKVSYSIFYMLMGMVLYAIMGNFLPPPDPIAGNIVILRLTELAVIISLMGTGLKIDQPFSFRQWAIPFRLVSITMVLSIALVAFVAVTFLHFPFPAAVLLGAVLAPTDPVLASDVQVGPPLEEARDKVRFSLTAEAGMNDGTAFPFTWLAILLATASPGSSVWGGWVLYELLYKIIVGVGVGYFLGKALAFLVFRMPQKNKYIVTKDGFVAISATLLVYGLTELVHGYGFIAVFVTAVTLRNYELHHKYHRKLHDFTDQTERILIAIVLILFGGSLVSGVLKPLTWELAAFGLLFVLLIRPLTAFIGMIGNKLHLKQKLAIGFFGIKGMGSFFYLSFAMHETFFGGEASLWAVTAFVVFLSVLIHGLTATPVMSRLEQEFGEAQSLEHDRVARAKSE